MTMDDSKVVPMEPSTVVPAFGSGQVDAAGIWYPFVDVIKETIDFRRDNPERSPEITATFPGLPVGAAAGRSGTGRLTRGAVPPRRGRAGPDTSHAQGPASGGTGSRPRAPGRRASSPAGGTTRGSPVTGPSLRSPGSDPGRRYCGITICSFTSLSRASTARSKPAMLSAKGMLAEIRGFRSTLPAAMSAIARS
ncbi:hypothetical protein SAMN04488105_12810 [Salipiger thiooxidans]|uniref:Uncharacterized protein n=1 Tax=Salipiger thiooxidans TaxID=282683 RepID=A0A1G7LY21_9RHOB|nr:hypothetical protein SAMN04488105_12810 [Salipiger thiooxidans]